MDITNLHCRTVAIDSVNRGEIRLDISGVSESEILDLFDEAKVVDHFDKDVILETIGEDYCRKYFGIE